MGFSMEREPQLKSPPGEGTEDSVVRGSLNPSRLCSSLQLYPMRLSGHLKLFFSLPCCIEDGTQGLMGSRQALYR